jgi:hypothetical protein
MRYGIRVLLIPGHSTRSIDEKGFVGYLYHNLKRRGLCKYKSDGIYWLGVLEYACIMNKIPNAPTKKLHPPYVVTITRSRRLRYAKNSSLTPL